MLTNDRRVPWFVIGSVSGLAPDFFVSYLGVQVFVPNSLIRSSYFKIVSPMARLFGLNLIVETINDLF